jgi:DNA polymerase-1
MVAQTIELPNIRKLFIPDPGYIIADADLSGADAQVVAWEAEDEDLKAAFRAGLKVHAKNAIDMWGESVVGDGTAEPYYSQIKRSVHATNYGASARTVARSNGWTVHEAERFQRRWFDLHPGIAAWHQRVEASLSATRSVSNAFGFRRLYFDRIDGLLPEALAWIPQSTVAIVTIKAALQLEEQVPWCELLVQVHDSLVFQYPKSRIASDTEGASNPSLVSGRAILAALSVTIPYPDPLTIPWGIKTSEVSWGDCE